MCVAPVASPHQRYDASQSVAPPSNLYDFSFLAPCPSSGLMINGDKDRAREAQREKERAEEAALPTAGGADEADDEE